MTGSPRLYLVRPPSFPTLRSPDLHGEGRHRGPAHALAHPHEHVHGHAHGHADCVCGHAHAPAADQVAGPLEWRKAVSAILAMGLRPCSGALIVLVFALSQGFFAAGIAAALAMGLGTGLTVAALAVLAVLVGGAATCRETGRAAWGGRVWSNGE